MMNITVHLVFVSMNMSIRCFNYSPAPTAKHRCNVSDPRSVLTHT